MGTENKQIQTKQMTKILTDMTTMIAFYMIPLATNSILL
jgi:hypothetical protein